MSPIKNVVTIPIGRQTVLVLDEQGFMALEELDDRWQVERCIVLGPCTAQRIEELRAALSALAA